VYWGYGLFTGVESEIGWDGAYTTFNVIFRPFEGAELSLGFDMVRMRLVGTIAF
jgi:hypothetical protein